jgi:hypothetical protein
MTDTVNMGVGSLASPGLIFCRSFRWIFEAEHFLSHFANKIRFDFTKKRIYLTIWQTVTATDDTACESWLKNFDNSAKFTVLDGCGHPLYEIDFSVLKVEKYTSGAFDYGSSDIATDELEISYCCLQRKCYYAPDFGPPPAPKVQVEMDKGVKIGVSSRGVKPREEKPEVSPIYPKMEPPKSYCLLEAGCYTVPATLDKKPTLEIEEIEVPRLNSKMYLPGRSRWQHLTIKFASYPLMMDSLRKSKEITIRQIVDGRVTEHIVIKGIETLSLAAVGTELHWKIAYTTATWNYNQNS